MEHIPVMVGEVMEFLLHEKSTLVVDGTLGAGGHAEAILEARPDVRLIGIDRDPLAIELATNRLQRFGDRARIVQGVFSDIDAVLADSGPADGILLDLGLSSMQIDTPTRGFSHSATGPLDMRMAQSGATVHEFLGAVDEQELARVIREYGEVRGARRLARQIKHEHAAGNIGDTAALRAVVASALGAKAAVSVMNQVFQALRIAVNDELRLIDVFLAKVIDCVAPGGRIVIISYHSLEDRAVKQFFRRESTACVCPPETPVCVCGHVPSVAVLTRRAVRPTPEEAASNTRSRSARLRAVEVLTREAVN